MTLRLVLALSLDGRLAPPDGGAAQIGGAGDREVLEQALAWADAVMLGAGTLRAHGSSCQIRRPELLAARQQRGVASQPITLVVSRSCTPPGLQPEWLFWRQPLQRWLVAPAPVGQPAPSGFERLLPLQGWPELLAQLRAEGLHNLVLLGGAQLAGELLQADVVDELQFTLCPLLLGGAHSWLPAQVRLQPQRWTLLEQRLLADGELLLRYGRSGNS